MKERSFLVAHAAAGSWNRHLYHRHGFGYSVFEHTEGGIRSELWIYVAVDAPVKFSVLKLSNQSGRSRRISATGYVDWVLGDSPPKSTMHVVTGIAADGGALLARNSYNTEFADRVAFFDVDDPTRTVTGDRSGLSDETARSEILRR
jgi:cellobiose phosphorylase